MPENDTRATRRGRGGRIAAIALAVGGFAAVAGGANPASAAGNCVDYNYSQGGYSSCVGHIQELVNYFTPQTIAVDNSFGPQTRASVESVQRTFGLTVDGVVGPETWNIICAPQAGPGPIAGFPYGAASAAGC